MIQRLAMAFGTLSAVTLALTRLPLELGKSWASVAHSAQSSRLS